MPTTSAATGGRSTPGWCRANAAGNHSTRDIRPRHVYDRWLSAWCHLRDDEREFRLGGIEFVAPVG